MVPLIACIMILIFFVGLVVYSEHNKKKAHHPGV